MELLAHGDMVFDILDQQAHEDVRKKLLLAQEELGRGKGGLGWHLSDAAALFQPFRIARASEGALPGLFPCRSHVRV